jgi:hypothetical protein
VAWARIDDAFDDHPKVLALLDMDGAAAAIGLWTLCLTYAHRNTRKRGKTPGLIPFTLPRRFFGAEGRAMAGLLVEVGLWDEVEDGWMIHDFAEYLPAKEVSAARSEAGKKGAAKRWGSKSDTTDDKPMAEQKQDDGNLPSDDDSWPFDDDNAVASDGSRAGAHRGIPVPGPVPIPPTAGADAPRPEGEVTTQTIVGEWIERCKKRPPSNVIGQISKQIKTMLDEGIAPDDIRRGLAEWMTKDVHPSVLPSLVNSAMNASGGQPTNSNGTGSQLVARTVYDASKVFKNRKKPA